MEPQETPTISPTPDSPTAQIDNENEPRFNHWHLAGAVAYLLAFALVLTVATGPSGSEIRAAIRENTNKSAMKFPALPKITVQAPQLVQRASSDTSDTISGPDGLKIVNRAESFAVLPSFMPQGTIRLAWNAANDDNVRTYALYYWMTSTGAIYRISAGTNLTATLSGLVEGAEYEVYAVSVIASGIESIPSNSVKFIVPVRTYLSVSAYAIQSYGLEGVTNLMQMSTNLQTWTAVASFVGKPGQAFTYNHTNLGYGAYFRVIRKP